MTLHLRRRLPPPTHTVASPIVASTEFDSLLGVRRLSGVDYGLKDVAAGMYFVLDGITMSVWENESDGYRSSMDRLDTERNYQVRNRFIPVWVRVQKHSGSEVDGLEFVDLETGEVVVEFGTDDSDDYYPSFVCNFQPENLCLNVGRK